MLNLQPPHAASSNVSPSLRRCIKHDEHVLLVSQQQDVCLVKFVLAQTLLNKPHSRMPSLPSSTPLDSEYFLVTHQTTSKAKNF